MIQMSIRIVAPAAKRCEILQTLKRFKGPTEALRGCRYCRVLCDADDERVLTYLEQWDTQADLEEHLRSERYRRLLPLIELSTEPPEIEFRTFSTIRGLEYLIALLSSERER